MKYSIIILILLFLNQALGQSIQLQNPNNDYASPKYGELGLSTFGGVILANISSDCSKKTCAKYELKPGFQFGLSYNRLPFILGLGFSSRGVQNTDLKMQMNIKYFEIFIDYPYRLGPGLIWGGGKLGILLDNDMIIDGRKNERRLDDSEGNTISYFINTLSIGLNLGYSYSINEIVSIKLVYFFGLSYITYNFVGSDGNVYNELNKHRDIEITANYALPF